MYTIELENGQKIIGEILKMDKKLLKIKMIVIAPITIFDHAIKVGDRIVLDNSEFVVEDISEGGVKLSNIVLIERKNVKKIEGI
ncbi:hypothetical protein GFS03_08275 [Sulfolobus sp. E5-1-F]|uniref:hypothetical protein n=1 Tax=Saccharolobus sp. E5-1-F TaxID=2663019 RepID=UPI0012961589|nr:hypothetical protein [Sulfolobus sp. E5-1-F]QGA54564.1 hypothetical protein GFS03_08275 [Sulfolobus sp. E5-1-F]